MRKEAENWLARAEKDFTTSRYLFKGKKYEAAAFFCQQCVEKALKAVFIHQTEKIVKTHDLVYLARTIHLPLDLEEGCKELTMIYVSTRYPDVPETKLERERTRKFIKFSKEVMQWAKKQV
jgi:HEPN domain-containing protein